MFQGNGFCNYTVIFIRFSNETFNKLELSHLHLFGRTSISHLNIITSSVKEFQGTAQVTCEAGREKGEILFEVFSENANL